MSFRILSSPERVVIGGCMAMQPFVRYVLPAGPAQHFAAGLRAKAIGYTMSVFNAYARPYGGTDLNGKRLAFYRHAAFGDQLMATSVPVYLKHLFPNAQIDVYCSPEVIEVWNGLPVRAFPAPITLEAARAYDAHLFYDQMLEEDREPDQDNAYDSLFRFAGLSDVPDIFKRPKVVSLESDLEELGNLNVQEWLPEKYLVYQLGAGNANRSYPMEQGREFIRRFLEAFTDWHVIVVGTDRRGDLAQLLGAGPDLAPLPKRTINLVNGLKRFRSLIPLVQRAGLVVCPDSSIGHLAAAFPQVPVISLWGLFAPNDRVKYYANHHALWPREVCPFAPCHNHDFKLPQEKCELATNATPGEQKWCNVLRAVSPERILEKATQILSL